MITYQITDIRNGSLATSNTNLYIAETHCQGGHMHSVPSEPTKLICIALTPPRPLQQQE